MAQPLKDILGGPENVAMTPGIAQNITVLDSTLSCWFDAETTETEVALFGRYLDILVRAEIPGTGEEIAVAVENQYGPADPDHFGRLIGWYMPEVGAEMGVLIAESFEPHLVRAVTEGQIIQPRHGLWLVEAAGYEIGGMKSVSYTLRATSLQRERLLARETAHRKNYSGSTGGEMAKIEANSEKTERLYLLLSNGQGSLANVLKSQKTVGRWYRMLETSQKGNMVSVFVGQNRISIGSGYRKGQLNPETLDQLTVLNKTIDLDPNPFKRELRTLWWKLADFGRATPDNEVPETLEEQVQRAYDDVLPAIREHQERISEILEMLS
jgi:hypothetical protein